jgi:hypothetical protein
MQIDVMRLRAGHVCMLVSYLISVLAHRGRRPAREQL